ncbi:hypothetical protein C8A01DRAFT_20122, partial [Parachaetomium inaequale]
IPCSSRTSRIEDRLNENSIMVKEIHAWWLQNLRDATIATVIGGDVHSDQPLAPRPPTSLCFEVHLSSGNQSQVLCARACPHDDWKDSGTLQLFVCRCSEAENTGQGPRHPRVENIALSPFSFPYRQAGEASSWTLFKALDKSTNQMVSITIKNVTASDIAEFEASFIHPLAAARADAMLQNGISNQLAHLSLDGGRVRALNLHSDLSGLHTLIESVTFRAGHRSLTKSNVAGLSLLNYRELEDESARTVDSALDQAELSIYCGGRGTNDTEDITKTIVHPARKLHQKLKDMRTELFITALQSPRPDETVVLHLQATDVQCEVAIISDAELLITRNRQGKYRLIVTSRNRCTVLTQVLPDAFFTAPHFPGQRFASPTWVIQLEDGGRRKVTHHPNGFRFMSFRNSNAERMFELGRTAVLQGAQPQALPIEGHETTPSATS